MKIRLISIFIAVIVFVSLFSFSADAATTVNCSISTKESSIYVTKNIDVTVKFTSKGGSLSFLQFDFVYDQTMFDCVLKPKAAAGGAGKFVVLESIPKSEEKYEFEYAFKFKALIAGNTEFKVIPTQAVDAKTDTVLEIPNSSARSLKVVPSPAASKENRLSSLEVSPGELTPKFDSDVFDYDVTVPFETKEIIVSSQLLDKTAIVDLSDTKLNVGDNIISVSVTAQNGERVIYRLNVKRLSSEFMSPSVNIGASDYKISNDYSSHNPPKGFFAASAKYKGNEILVYQSNDEKVKICYLEKENEGKWFVYNLRNESFEEFVGAESRDTGLTIVPFPSDVSLPDAFQLVELEKDGVKYNAYKINNAEETTYVVYGVTSNGDSGLYLYNTKTQNFISYFDADIFTAYEQIKDTKEDLASAKRTLLIFEIISAAVAMLLFIMIAVFILTVRIIREKNVIINVDDDETAPPVMSDKDTAVFNVNEEDAEEPINTAPINVDPDDDEPDAFVMIDDEYFQDNENIPLNGKKNNKRMNKKSK